jgi:aspartate carbamoyltransferase catalytic subunit
MRARKGEVSQLTVALCGDLHAGRTVHSLATALARVGARIVCVAPEGLRLPAYVTDEVRLRYGADVEYVDRMEDCLPDADVLYMTRLQRERLPAEMANIAIPRVDRAVLEKMRPDTIILHPLPRVDEIDYWVDFDPRAAYFEQAAAGVLVRMALLDLLLSEDGFATVARPFRAADPPNRYARCDNQGCIVRREAYVPHRPVVTDWSPGLPRCAYCEMPLVQGALPLSERDGI